MVVTRPTWQLVLDATRRLTASGHTPFTLADILQHVQRADETRNRGSIQPVVQGMTVNAGKGPAQPCGAVLVRVDRGLYALRDQGDAARTPRPPVTPRPSNSRRARLLSVVELQLRCDRLIADFDRCVDTYDASVPFRRSGQFEYHRRTIDLRRKLGPVEAAIEDATFTELLYETLQKWGIGHRASRLTSLDDFRRRLQEHRAQLVELEPLILERLTDGLGSAVVRVDRLISGLQVVDNRALIVAGTKTLHHLLPNLVPPMDRAWTGAFFGWSSLDPQHQQLSILDEAFHRLVEIARATRPSRLVGDGWRTSATKVLDNAVVGYCIREGIGVPQT